MKRAGNGDRMASTLVTHIERMMSVATPWPEVVRQLNELEHAMTAPTSRSSWEEQEESASAEAPASSATSQHEEAAD